MVRAKLTLANPGDIEATITMTATLDEWQKIRADLRQSSLFGPADKLVRQIDGLAHRAATVFELPGEAGEAVPS